MKTKIWAALIALYLAWGSTYLAIHYAVQSIPPFFMSGIRFLVAGIILYAWRRLAGDPHPTVAQWRSSAVIGTLLLVGGIGGVSWAEQSVPSGIAALVVAATPVWVVLIDAIRSAKRPTLITGLGVASGLMGIFILIDPMQKAGGQHSYNIVGIIILLLAALSWSVGSIFSHEVDLPKSALLASGMELLAGSAGSFIIGLVMGEAGQIHLGAITGQSVAGLAYLIVVGSLVGFVCYTWLLQVASTTLVVTYAYVNPLVAVLLGSLLAGEVLTPKVMVATPLILLAVFLIQARQARRIEHGKRLVTMSEAGGDD